MKTTAAKCELLRRAKFLMQDDRRIIELAFIRHLSVRQIAEMVGERSGAVSRRIVKLCNRLRSPTTIMLIDEAFPFPLPPEHRWIGIEHLVAGRKLREIAGDHQMPIEEVRRIVAFTRGWADGVAEAAKRRRVTATPTA